MPGDDGSRAPALHVAGRQGEEEQVVRPAVRRLRHDLRPEGRQRRDRLSDQAR